MWNTKYTVNSLRSEIFSKCTHVLTCKKLRIKHVHIYALCADGVI